MFVDLEKAFDRVPREVTRFDLRQKGVPEYLVDSVMSLQKDSNLSSQGTIKFIFCEVSVHQGSALSPLFYLSC